jgi:hypothetical protein
MRTRGTGYVFQPKYKDKSGTVRHVSTWYIRWRDHAGQQHREAVKDATTKAEAEKILRQRLSDRDAGRPTGAAVEKTTLEDLAKLITTDYEINGRRSGDDLKARIVHLAEFFKKDCKANSISKGRVDEYKKYRLEQKAKPGTINRELACLRRMFISEWTMAGSPSSPRSSPWPRRTVARDSSNARTMSA